MSVLYTTRFGRTPSDSISSSIDNDSSQTPLSPVARIIAAYVYSSGFSPATAVARAGRARADRPAEKN